MKKFFVVFALFCAMLFFVSCGETNSTVTTTTVVNDDDEDTNDADVDDATDDTGDTVDDTSDTTEPDDGDTEESGKKQGELYGRCYPNKTCNEGLECDEENDTCIKDPGHTDNDEPGEPDEDSDTTPDNDTDTDTSDTLPDQDTDTDTGDTQPLESTENHTISGSYQIGSDVSGIETALYECGKTEKIASANTNAKGAFSFKADISATKTYCVKAGDFASCFKGMSDHTANISEITTAAYLLDKTCADLRKSETKIRTYAKLGTGEWLGELDYSKLSGIKEGFKLLSTYINSTENKTLSEKIAEDSKKETPEFEKFFNGFRVSLDKNEVIIGETADSSANFGIEGGSAKVAPNFKITWTLKNKSAEAATYKFTTSNPGEYVARAKLTSDGGDPIMLSNDSATVLFLQRKTGGTVYVSDTSKNISFRIDDGIYGVIPKGTVVKKGGSKINSISYTVLSAGGNQVSRLEFGPAGAVFEGDTMYFVHELSTVFGGDPIMLSATRTNADGSVDVMNSAAGDPIMMAAAGDPIMTTAAGDPIMQAAAGDPIMNSAAGDPIMTAAAGDPIMTSAAGDPIMTSAAGDPIMSAAAGDPIMTSAAGDPIMTSAAGDPIMMGTSSSAMISQTSHYSTFTVEAASLHVSVDTLVARWCDGSFYRGYSPIKFIKEGFEKYKPESTLLPYLDCDHFADLGNDLYELMNKPVGYQRNLNLFENLFFVSEFYNRMNAKRESGALAAVKNGLELRTAIAALYTATTSYNRSTNMADLFDSTMIPLTYNGTNPKDYTSKAKVALTGNANAADRYAATKKEMMIFANYITTSSKGPDFNSVSAVLNPDQLVCAWFNPETMPQNCNKVYTINDAGHVTLGGTEVSVAEANAIFTKYFMPFNSRLDDEEKLHLFRTLYLALKYAGTIFYNGTDVEELNDSLLETAYLVFDGIDGNANAVSIVDSFDASAHTVSVLDGNEMAARPYLTKLSALTDKISLKVASESADVEKVLINIEGKEFEKVQENTRTYYKQTGDLKEKSIVLTPGSLSGTTSLKTLLGSENVDELGNITGKMTIVATSKISDKTYSTQKTYDFFVNDDSDGVNSKEVPADIQIFVHDSTGHAIPEEANPTIILNPGNKVYYPENGVVSIENLTPAAYTVDAYADRYYAKNVSVNVPAGANFSVEIRLDEELTSTDDASLELNVKIDTAKHPSKVYIQIYNDDMDLVANETAKFNNETNTYDKVNVKINSGRYTLLAVGEDLYRYLEAITLYEGLNTKEIKVVAKNACGNGIVDSAEECEPSLTAPVSCGTIYPASTYPEKTATCDPNTCTFDKQECGKAAYCGDGILDAGEGCDGGSKACAEIAGLGDSKGTAPCKNDDCSGYITAGNCTRSTASCGSLPANAQWNDGEGTFAQAYDGANWIPAAKSAEFGTTKEECTFSCTKGYKWNGTSCEQYPLSLGLICTGETGCFDTENETECPAYGEALFGQDAQYAETGFCTEHVFTTSGSGDKKIVTDAYTHYEWTAATSENAMNWSAADDYCSHIDNESGSTAVWRLPSPAELLTIIDADNASPALDNNYFTAYGHTFWAKEDIRNNGNAWRIDENGALASVAKTESYHVLCVRIHDYDITENRFTAENETVKDNESGLMWQKQPVASRTWAEALNYCEEVATSDKFDWRLPNRNELASLINYEKATGAMSDFPGIAAKGFWTSTTDISSAANAWTVDFATGSISSTEKTSTKYIICVRNDEPCFGDECPNVCGFDQCRNMDNSTGLCTANGYDFTCGCKSGFNWNHAKCLLDTTRYIACTGLPENAVWNTVFGISQTYDGNKWYPSEVGTFNKIESSTECRFKCATNYKWDADEEKCLPVSRIANCSEKKPYSDWNVVSKISQTWDGEKWEPSSESEYNTEQSEEECRFVCKEHYNWDSENNICDPERQPAICIGLPVNAHWWNEPSITQTWTNGGWAPSATGTHSTDAEENRCYYTCDTNYEWNDTSCVAKTQTKNCTGLPDNAEWNGNTSITQTWDGTGWFPNEAGTYNPESNQAYCRYKCKENYNWNGSACVPETHIANCVGLPEHALWNTVSSITQTYMNGTWAPSTTATYRAEAVDNECHFVCMDNYNYDNTTGKCNPVTKTVDCVGLPSNASWINSAIAQTWTDNGWMPAATGHHKSVSAEGCSFDCNTNYEWNSDSASCVGAKHNGECTGLPANAQWVGSVSIQQTWNGSSWLPELTGSYGEQAIANECRFKCKNNYQWNGTGCVGATKTAECNTKPENTVWNTVAAITQTYNGSDYAPSTAVSYCAAPSTENCCYKCAENYTWNGTKCVGATRENQACTGLPANAEWWNGSSSISQTWNGTEWAPSTAGNYSASAVSGECRFKCSENFTWNGTGCIGATRTNQQCGDAPANATWQNPSISQTWTLVGDNTYDWRPTLDAHHKSVSEEGCSYVCNENFTWNGTACVGATRIENCTGLLANTQWNTVSSIKQTYTKNADNTYGWSPSNVGTYGAETTEECHFKCKEYFEWKDGECKGTTKPDNACTGLPLNAEWVGGNTVEQTWNGSSWVPSTEGHHDSVPGEGCVFTCKTNYTWTNNECKPDTRNEGCTGLPTNAEWLGSNTINQTWNGSSWLPELTGSYSDQAVAGECRFKCQNNYQWNGTICVGATKTADCNTKPENTVWNTVAAIMQTYNGSDYTPSTAVSYSETPSTENCYYKCAENYTWNGTSCVGATRENQACTGLPANAEWRGGVTAITQTWNGSEWINSTVGSYSENNDATHCYFKCQTNFTWNGASCVGATRSGQICSDLADNAAWLHDTISQTWTYDENLGYYDWRPVIDAHHRSVTEEGCSYECKANFTWNGTTCVGTTRIESCTGLSANAQWNTVSSIKQTWTKTGENSYDWSPSTSGEFGNETTTECHFKCKENYTWNAGTGTCDANTQEVVCEGLIANAEWVNGNTVNQTWDGFVWSPTAKGHHKTGVGEETCAYECVDNYTWDADSLFCKGATQTATCTGKPESNASWHNTSITQTWNGSAWLPTEHGSYSQTNVTNECRFYCDTNYIWNGSSCEAAEQIVSCGTLPANALWNTVSQIKQTWNGSAWEPAANSEYNNVPSETECRYTCKENYEWNNTACVAKTQTVACTGLPANAVWNSATVEQTWTGTMWSPETTGTHTTGNETDKCYFKCIDEGTKFDWVDSTCKGHTNSNIACDNNSLPANASWWNANINQTWSGSEWLPTTTGSFSNSAVDNQCRFYCDNNYTWNGLTCDPVTRIENCDTLPANAEWNTASSIEQHWDKTANNGLGDFVPSITPEYNTESSTAYCRFKCKENYSVSDDGKSCVAATKTADCKGLPRNAEWNTAETITQTWNGTEWLPTVVGAYGLNPTTENCIFKCIEHYDWQSGMCVAAKESTQCKGLPANAMWNEVASIVREWQGSAWDISDNGEYNEEPSKTECRFKCKPNYTWDGSKCQADTRVVDCLPRPANSVWNEVPYITQTWNGSEWLPKLEPQYSASPSTTECRYSCNTGFYPINGKCVENPCSDGGVNPCTGVTNSTGICKKEDNLLLPYSCECMPGYHWWGKAGCREKAVTLGNVCTGLDKCYTDDTEIPCPQEGEYFYGQDATYADKGYCAPKTFVLKETTVGAQTHTTLVDRNTELEWSQPHEADSWYNAVDYCENLNYGGNSDWRLPSIKELMTLVNYKAVNRKLTEYFNGLYYAWSSTDYAVNHDKAFLLDTYEGTVYRLTGHNVWNEEEEKYEYVEDTKVDNYEFVCVRGSELPENDFDEIDINGNGETVIKDFSSNLYWMKTPVEKEWRQGLSYCENLTYGGFSDWRMPNINELLSIVDFSVDYTESLALDNIFGRPSNPNIWEGITSTTATGNGMNYYIYFEYFLSSYDASKDNGGVLYCVRSDLCDEGEFWDGKNCAANPCREDSCDMENSDGICKPLSAGRFSCGCVDGYLWSDSSESCLKNPCLDDNFNNKCENMRGSDGNCTIVDETNFTCGCNEGYFWSISSCRKKSALASICTGLTQCFNNDEVTAYCPQEGWAFYGQDANYAEKGACVPKSFSNAAPDSGHPDHEVVIDNNTGLMWQKYASSGFTFNQAIGECADLEYAGYTDWRLPNLIELNSIVDFGESTPLDSGYFPPPFENDSWTSYKMWSSVSVPGVTTSAYYLFVIHEEGVNVTYINKTNELYFRCVRGNTMSKSSLVRWTENGAEVLVDPESGLMLDPEYKDGTWEETLSSCENSDYAGHTDWRMANINELYAMPDYFLSTSDYWAGTSTRNPNGYSQKGQFIVEDNGFKIGAPYNGGYCVRSGNIPANMPIDFVKPNMSCFEVVKCASPCIYLDCKKQCTNNSLTDARYQYEDMIDCFEQNSQNCNSNECMLDNCAAEVSSCFSGATESGFYRMEYGVYYSIGEGIEGIGTNMSCQEISDCMNNCNNDQNCILSCYDHGSSAGRIQYDDLVQCISDNNDYCVNEEDPDSCLLFTYCQAEFQTCVSGNSSSGGTCSYEGTNLSCGEFVECYSECDDYQECLNRTSIEGQSQLDDYIDCISNYNCSDMDCIYDNCMTEYQTCFQ